MSWFRVPTDSQEEIYRRLSWAIFLRVVIVTFLLGASAMVHIRQYASFTTRPLLALYLLIGLTYFFTLVSVLLIRRRQRLWFLTYLQIVWEVAFITGVVYVTGGLESIFSFMYLLSIITASILLYRQGAYLAAVFSALAYAGLLFCMQWEYIQPIIAPTKTFENVEIVWNIFINVVAFLGVSFLTSILSDQLRATSSELRVTQEDRDQITALNDNIVRSVSSGLLTVNNDNRITSFNRAASRITDLNAGKALDKTLDQVFPGLEPATLMADANSGRTDTGPPYRNGPLSFKMPYRNQRGESLFLEMIMSPLFNPEGQAIGWLIIFSDITRIRDMETRLRQADRLAAVGQLAAGMAHEIRNPLAAISGSIQMLDQELKLDQDGTHLMKIVLRETDRLNQLITEFLVFARPIPRSIESIDLGLLIADLVNVFSKRQDIPSGIKVEQVLSDNINLETDPQLIKQILWNMINNAVEAMPEGGTMRIKTRQIKEDTTPAEMVELIVEDTGTGIAPENLARIFDPFFTTRERGTGLGLSTVYRIVEAMAGEISVESQPGKGSAFIVHIPRRPHAESEHGDRNFRGPAYGGKPSE